MARIYPPHIFAVWAVAFSAVGIFSSIATLRFDLAIITEKSEKDAAKAFHLCIIFPLFFLFLLLCFIFVIKRFGVYFTETSVSNSISLFCLWCFIAVNINAISTWQLRSGNFVVISFSQILSTVIILAIQIVGGKISNGNPQFLIIGSIVGGICALIILTKRKILVKIIPEINELQPQRYTHFFLKNKNFVKYSLVSSVIASLRERVPVLFLGNYVTAAEVSFYSQSKRICGAPGNLISSILRPVFFYSVNNTTNKNFEEKILKSLKIILWIGLPIAIILMFFSNQFFTLLLGDKWKEIGSIISLMILPGLLDALVSWMDRIFDSKGRQDLNLRFELAFGVSSMLGLFVILVGTKNLLHAIAFQSLIICVGNLLILFTFFKVANFKQKQLAVLLMQTGALGLAFSLLCIAIKNLK